MPGAIRSLDDFTGEIVDAAYKQHVGRGLGLPESIDGSNASSTPFATPHLRVNNTFGAEDET